MPTHERAGWEMVDAEEKVAVAGQQKNKTGAASLGDKRVTHQTRLLLAASQRYGKDHGTTAPQHPMLSKQ